MRLLASVLLLSGLAAAQSTPPTETDRPALEFTGAPLVLPYQCHDEDLDWAGLSCGEDPCPIYLELNHAAGKGKTIVVVGNFHAATATMASVLLLSEDGGRTWREAANRVRGATLDHIQLIDTQNFRVSGELMQPLPMDPFFLISSDAGKSWDRVSMFEEGTPSAVLQFEFDSRDHGTALVDSGGGDTRYELLETQSGGREWSVREKGSQPPHLKSTQDAEWRVHAEKNLFRLQHLEDNRWAPFASFALNVARCKPEMRAEPAEPSPAAEPEGAGVADTPSSAPPSSKRKKPKN